MGDFVDNYRLGLPSELAVLTLFDRATGAPKAIIDASRITDMRTGAVTAVGAKYLARKDSKVLAHIGSRGTAYWNVRLLDHLFHFDEIRIHSRHPESRLAFGERLTRELGRAVVVTDDWRSCVEGADIVVEASRLVEPTPLLKTEWIKRSALVIPYGTMSAVELSLTDIMTKLWSMTGRNAKTENLARCVNMLMQASSQCRPCTRNLAKSSLVESRVEAITTRRSCSGIVVYRSPTSPWAMHCCKRAAA